MEQFKTILGILVFTALTVFTSTFAQVEVPSPGKVYAFRNAMDGGLAMNLGTGKICQGLAPVVPIYGVNPPYPEKYLWTVSPIRNFTGGVTIHNKIQEEGYIINSLTFDEYPPYCYPVYRDIALTPTEDGCHIIIKNIWDDQCLTSQGSEVGIFFWMPCGGGGQSWNFIEVPE